MDTGLEWDRVLIAILLLGCMFALPAIVIWRDLRRDLRRFGPDAQSRPVRYTLQGQPYREGLPLPGADAAGAERATGGGRPERPASGPVTAGRSVKEPG